MIHAPPSCPPPSAALLAAPAAAAEPLPRIAPEQAGFSAEGLARIGAVLDRDIADGKLPGAVLAIARDGKLVHLQAYGYRDKAAGVADDHGRALQHRLDDEAHDRGGHAGARRARRPRPRRAGLGLPARPFRRVQGGGAGRLRAR